uniref:Apelin n=1 Tax=Oncorhynchus kisutch TaxID=8019 RepID=A0A8C7H6U1_ONCKI
MNVGGHFGVLTIVSCHSTGPIMDSTEHGTALEQVGGMRRLVQQNPGRGSQSHRPAGWKRRRPRPRLSHKGPMPF